MRFAALSSVLAFLAGQSLAALTANAPGILVTVNPDGQTITVPVLDAVEYAFNPDPKAAHHALRISPVSSEEAGTILLSGQGLAPSEFTETVTLTLSHPAASGSQFLVTADDDVVSELLHKRTEELPGRVRRAVVGTSSLADGPAGQLLDKRSEWGCAWDAAALGTVALCAAGRFAARGRTRLGAMLATALGGSTALTKARAAYYPTRSWAQPNYLVI
ncbi:hypothetical protein QBC43DRAFT_334573 [Cladorrhinum sp. PSN259]|nr:hypothetical protein QBC43DRAFT_334573 [Cladorrhinum sp. PSN259]